MLLLLKRPVVKIISGLGALLVIFVLLGFLIFVKCVNYKAHSIGRADGIVVLTGGPARIEEAVKLLSEDKGERLLISGVHHSTSRRDLLRLVPQHKDLFDCCIDIDHKALNTIGNASQTYQWVKRKGFDSLIVVTASYHMPRSLVELRRVLPDVELLPYPISSQNVHSESWWAYPGTLWLLTREYFKTITALARLGLTRITYYVAG